MNSDYIGIKTLTKVQHNVIDTTISLEIQPYLFSQCFLQFFHAIFFKKNYFPSQRRAWNTHIFVAVPQNQHYILKT